MNRKLLDCMYHFDKNIPYVKLKKKVSSEEIIKLQNQQLLKLEKIDIIIKEGRLEEGIQQIEDVMYNQGGIIFNGVSWPMYLADLLFKNKMYDRCWKYLNYLSINYLNVLDKVRKLQAKILYNEEKYKDALINIIASFCYETIPVIVDENRDKERIKKSISKYIKKVNLNITTEELVDKVYFYFINRELEEKTIIDELRKLLV